MPVKYWVDEMIYLSFSSLKTTPTYYQVHRTCVNPNRPRQKSETVGKPFKTRLAAERFMAKVQKEDELQPQ